jgi:hypothetical protein
VFVPPSHGSDDLTLSGFARAPHRPRSLSSEEERCRNESMVYRRASAWAVASARVWSWSLRLAERYA